MKTCTVSAPHTARTTPTAPRARRSIARSAFLIVLCSMAVSPVTSAQQADGGVTERVITRTKRDVNGKQVVDQKIVTRASRTDDREDVVVEVFLPSMQADRLALSRRIHRVTTMTDAASQTVEECEERPLGSESEPLRLVERSVTTVRKTGPGSYASEQRVFQLDANGRLMPVVTDSATSVGRE